MPNAQPLSTVPHIDEYFGAWAMYEPQFNALREFAQQINVQLHLQQGGPTEAREAAAVQARSGSSRVQTGGLAVIEIRGTMMKHVSSFSSGTSTALARRALREAAADESIIGVMLVIDSPGGTVAGMHDLAADIAAVGKRKPIHGYAEDLAASAGYWALSQTSRISTGPGALIGSIGVFNVVHDLSAMAEKEGVKVHVVKFGEHKGAGVPGTVITDEQLAKYQTLVDGFGGQFVDAVSKGRKLPVAKVRDLADGQVHMGKAAMELGLVDAIESFDDAMRQLAAATSQSRSPAKGNAVTNEELKAALAQQRAAIVAACPGADEAFVSQQVAAGATAEEAGKAFMGVLAKRAADAEASAKTEKDRAEAAEKAAAEAAAKNATANAGPKRGNQPVQQVAEDAGDDTLAGDAHDDYVGKINELVAKGTPRMKAAALVARQNPQLREQMLREVNAGRE